MPSRLCKIILISRYLVNNHFIACAPNFFTAVQHERGPRNSTIRRQVAMYLRETTELASAISASAAPFRPPVLPPNMYLSAAAAGLPPVSAAAAAAAAAAS